MNGYANVVHTDFRARRSVQKYYEQPAHVRDRDGTENGKSPSL